MRAQNPTGLSAWTGSRLQRVKSKLEGVTDSGSYRGYRTLCGSKGATVDDKRQP
jgi:hypothetical protein